MCNYIEKLVIEDLCERSDTFLQDVSEILR